MKLTVCPVCHHRQWSFLYSPKFCRWCGRKGMKSYSLLEWIALAGTGFLLWYFLVN